MDEKENREIRFLGDLQRLSPLPGDIFVLSTDRVLSVQEHAIIQGEWNSYMPGFKLIVLESGMKIGCIGETQNG